MVEIPDNEYTRLKKDADDNRTMKTIARLFFLFIPLVIFLSSFGCHALRLYQDRTKAQNDVVVRQIEQGDLTMDEYIQWLKAKEN